MQFDQNYQETVEYEAVASGTLVWEVQSRMFLAGWLLKFYFEKCSNIKKKIVTSVQ